jgi:hypothetical protein
MWCGDENCEAAVKEKTGVGSRCILPDANLSATTASAVASPQSILSSGQKHINKNQHEKDSRRCSFCFIKEYSPYTWHFLS